MPVRAPLSTMTPVHREPEGVDYPDGFFARGDETDDAEFYSFPRYVTHIDDGAIAAVGALYDELGIAARCSTS